MTPHQREVCGKLRARLKADLVAIAADEPLPDILPLKAADFRWSAR